MEILNNYSCLGGNRKLWGDEHHIVAVERDPYLADMYSEMYPNDEVVVGDAHDFLLQNYKRFGFIWTSPPCPSHSRARFARISTTEAIYADMALYQEVILLETHFQGKYCVENVRPYYTPLIPAQARGRHLYWCNFTLPKVLSTRKMSQMMGKGTNEVRGLCKFHDVDFYAYKGEQRRDKIARNLVDYEAGKSILDAAIQSIELGNSLQMDLFKQYQPSPTET